MASLTKDVDRVFQIVLRGGGNQKFCWGNVFIGWLESDEECMCVCVCVCGAGGWGVELAIGGRNKNLVGEEFAGGNFSRWSGMSKFSASGGLPSHPPSRKNPAVPISIPFCVRHFCQFSQSAQWQHFKYLRNLTFCEKLI